ncbi:MAG: ammonia-forming cytochrome c nitrite reductase subunit c552, partial [Clostridia bacterium]|nr:ammonia-forming cytochrome c nitrite reductase subunit c552 [Clostridia bacterium]
CHMPVLENTKTQTVYHSHMLVSPLEDKTLLQTCLQCHTNMKTADDMITFVRNIQTRITDEETRIGNKLMEFKRALAKANQSGTMDEEQLNEIRELYRKAQWFFDYCYVENSEGAHNSDLSMRCLSTAEQLIKQGMALLTPAE